MKAKFCPQCGTKLKENAVFCSECGYKIQQNEEKIIVESEDNEIKPPKIKECKIDKDSNIKENESKKSHDNTKIKFEWPFDKTKTIIVVVIAIVLVLFISVIISNNAQDEYDGSGTISSENDDDYDYDDEDDDYYDDDEDDDYYYDDDDDDDDYYDDEMTESEIKSSIEDSTMEANDTFNVYYDGGTPTIDFKIQNDTDYYIYSADVDIKIGNHVYSKTVRGISPDSYEEVSIGLNFLPDDGSKLTYSFTVTDISYD